MSQSSQRSESQVDTVGRLLEASMVCYQEMLGIYRRIQKDVAVGVSAPVLQRHVERMRVIEQQARDSDFRAWEKANEADIDLVGLPRFSQWQTLLAQVWEENQVMQRRLQATLAMLQDECDRISNGKQGIAGYRSGRHSSGRRISIASV